MDYEKYLEQIPGPALFVFDLLLPMQQFTNMVVCMHEFECDFGETFEQLFEYISEEHTAEAGLDAFAERIIEDHHQAGNLRDGEVFGLAVKLVGRAMIEQMRLHKLYTYEGTAPYRFLGWADPYSPVLEKYIEADAFPKHL